MGIIRSLIGEVKAAVNGAISGDSSSKEAPEQYQRQPQYAAPPLRAQTQPRSAAYDTGYQAYGTPVIPQQPHMAYGLPVATQAAGYAQPPPSATYVQSHAPQSTYVPPQPHPQYGPAADVAPSAGFVNPTNLPYSPDFELQRASDLLAQADQELHQAYEEAKKKGGLIDATKTLGMAAYSQVTGQEGGPTYSEAAKRVVHDGRKPAIPLVESAYQKIQEAEAVLARDLHVDKAQIKAPKASTSVLAIVFHFGPIHAIVKASHKKKAIKNIEEMMAELSKARAAVDAALRRAQAARGHPPAVLSPAPQIL
eukprot:CAMPEP_0202891834 /NCGR_PEP_ID=MMETSP1392-20130828/1787_1 /ASSEMBLY_ACC=CAM_ASM_000868 /TAXON_ID=225041 /ORGANISM="Chlamydomonas chlamydogama, Strain SAG 11-48b" /LENGTH=308 /DNA_ID=CAMNT_0049575695 /DNA_START=61 /DNA_END=987 /DNA_ORIENTATION=+